MSAAAARANAEWCDAYCRRHGIDGRFTETAWLSPRRTPQFYPDAVTLVPDVDLDSVLEQIDAGPGCSLKDSFASLEPPGFDVLFRAEWLWLDDAQPSSALHAEVWSDAPVAVLTGDSGSAIANCSSEVIGLGNLEGDDLERLWHDAAGSAVALWGALPVVGYDRGAPLAAAHAVGFRTTGELVVWIAR